MESRGIKSQTGEVKESPPDKSVPPPHNFPCNWNACKCVLSCGESIAFLCSLRRRSPFLDILTL